MKHGNNETCHGQGGRSRESNARGGAEPTVAHQTSIPQQGLSARPLVLVTRGRVEFTAKCPGCTNWHRHRKLGEVRGPCGTTYTLQPRRGRYL